MTRYVLIPGNKGDETRTAYADLINGETIGGNDDPANVIKESGERGFVEESGPSDDPAGQGRKITGSDRLSAEDAATLAENDWITIVEEWPNDWVYKEVGEN